MERELITRAQADALLLIVPVVGLIAGAIALAWRRDLRLALLVGVPPLLIGALWRVYNAITDRIGLDRVANLGVNLVLFVAVGGIVGLVWGRIVSARSDNGPV